MQCALVRLLLEAQLAVHGAAGVDAAKRLHQCVAHEGWIWHVEVVTAKVDYNDALRGTYRLVRSDPSGARVSGPPERFDASFAERRVIALEASELDGDGAPDALVTTIETDSDFVWPPEERLTVFTVTAGSVEPLELPADLRLLRFVDFDKDGLVDVLATELVVHGEPLAHAVSSEANGPAVLLHARRGARLSTDDDIARTHLREQCPRVNITAALRRFARSEGRPLYDLADRFTSAEIERNRSSYLSALDDVVDAIGCARLRGTPVAAIHRALDRVYPAGWPRESHDFLYKAAAFEPTIRPPL